MKKYYDAITTAAILNALARDDYEKWGKIAREYPLPKPLRKRK